MPEQFFDPVGLTEAHTTRYTLTVYDPPRPPPRWLPSFLTRQPVVLTNTGSNYMILPDDINPNLDCFEPKHLSSLPVKTITIKSYLFTPELRCKHLQTGATVCDNGCYFREKGGKEIMRWCCKRSDCEGHVYCGSVMTDEAGKACFGEKGKRMVCLL
ncbi:hypothetical protein NX059_010269 [Plenodomus lindquistii]|nr:hypothetical protein NX059_010269 [Plenodomus lindquistii]